MRERYDIRPYNAPPIAPLPQHYSAPVVFQPAIGSTLPPEVPESSVIRPILRQWWLVALFALIGVGTAVAYIKHATPLYTAVAKIYIQPSSGEIARELGGTERQGYLATQVEVIKSTTILNRVAESDGIRGLKTFFPANGNPVLFLREQLNV